MFSGNISIDMSVYTNYTTEGQNVTLTCSNSSTSLPADYIPLTQYRWWRGGVEIEPGNPDYQLSQPGNSRLSISSVSREDHGLEYRCQGREENSTFTGYAGVTMDVRCKMPYLTILYISIVTVIGFFTEFSTAFRHLRT